MPLLALVQLDDLLGVDGQALVRVHDHAEEAGVRLEGIVQEMNSHYSRAIDHRRRCSSGGE